MLEVMLMVMIIVPVQMEEVRMLWLTATVSAVLFVLAVEMMQSFLLHTILSTVDVNVSRSACTRR